MRFFARSFAACLILTLAMGMSGDVWAQTSGVNSLPGTPLYLSAGGNTGTPFMTIGTSGLVGIGNTAPAAALDVSGAIHATGTTSPGGVATTIQAGNSCTPEGAMGYDLTNHQPVYCDNSNPNKWVAFAGSGSNKQMHWVCSGNGGCAPYTGLNSSLVGCTTGASDAPAPPTRTNTHAYDMIVYLKGSGTGFMSIGQWSSTTWWVNILDGSYNGATLVVPPGGIYAVCTNYSGFGVNGIIEEY